MIDDLKPYPEYKDSGAPWIGKVPMHWEMLPNRALIRKRKILVGENHKDYRLLSLTKEGIIVRDISQEKGKFSSDLGTSQEVRIGDLVFCLFDVPETPRTVGLSKHHGMITGAYTVFETLGRGCTEYFELFYRAMDDRKLLSPLYSGLRHTIPVGTFLVTKTPFPPLPEQLAIVRFLDHADRLIKQYIRAKQKLIKLLEEQKQAIIHRAVTRGLDPNVKLKPSGVEWLGEVPEGWEVVPLKELCDVQSGVTLGKQYMGKALVEYHYLRVANVQDGRLDLTEVKTIAIPIEEASRSLLEPGDVLMTEGGDPDKLGACRRNIPLLKLRHLGRLVSEDIHRLNRDEAQLFVHYVSRIGLLRHAPRAGHRMGGRGDSLPSPESCICSSDQAKAAASILLGGVAQKWLLKELFLKNL